jgi:membrane-associated phospholipid phosphatase
MFLTEINIFFQSFSSDSVTAIFKFFSFIGSRNLTVLLIIPIVFAIHFRYGTILIHLVFWNGIITDFFKEIFALPRPFNVDADVRLLGEGIPNPTPFKSMGAKSFFGGLPDQVIDYFREQGVRIGNIKSFGLPSGHTSNAVALWGAVLLFFGKGSLSLSSGPLHPSSQRNYLKGWLTSIASICIIFIPLSRLYLGRHFLADVLAGLLVGFMVLILFYKFVYRNEKLMDQLFKKAGYLKLNFKSILFAAYCLLFPFLLLLIPKINMSAAPALLGLNCGFFLLWLRGLPQEGGTILQRFGRLVVAIVFFFGVSLTLKILVGLIFTHEPVVSEFIRLALTMFSVIWGAVEACIKLKLYRR